MSNRFSLAPLRRGFGGKRDTKHFSKLSQMSSSAIASDYHQSTEGRLRMNYTLNPAYQPTDGRKGALVLNILNEMEPGIIEGSEMPSFRQQRDSRAEKPPKSLRRLFLCRALVVLIFISIIALVAGVISSGIGRQGNGNLNPGDLGPADGNGDTISPTVDGFTFAPTTGAPTNAPTTLAPTPSAPTTRAPTTPTPTPQCFLLFCG